MKDSTLIADNINPSKALRLKQLLPSIVISVLLSSLMIQNLSAFGVNETRTTDENSTKMIVNNDTSMDSGSGHLMSSTTIPPATDKFGIQMVYPTKPGGQEWYLNMGNPTADGRFNPQDHITKNPDGSWKMKSDKVRMYVYTSNGYKPNQLTSDRGLSKVASRGFMGTPADWRDVEITGYVKLNEFTENDNFVWFSRGGRHTDSDHCQGSAYKGNLFYHGETQFSKEQWHVSYAKSPTIAATTPLEGKWIGFKFMMYNIVTNDGNPAVKLENWIDANADGKNWAKVYEGADSGKWGRSGAECQVKADQILTWGGPIAAFRWDFAKDVDFRNLSVREITGDNGTLKGVNYFTGTSTSSDVPKFGNSIASTNQAGANNVLLNEALKNKFAYGNQANRNMTTNLSPSSTISDYWNNVVSGESSEQQQVISGDNVYVLWVRGDEDNTDLFLKISHDGGATFGNTINLSNNPASLSYHPKIVAIEENLYIVWEDEDGNSENSDIFFIESSDGGKTFSAKTNLSNDPSGSGTPQLFVSGGNVYVAWTGTSPDSTDILLAQSSDNGKSFTDPQNLSNDPDISYNPILSVNGSHIDVEWTDQDNKGFTKIKSKTLPNITNDTQVYPLSYADLPSSLNSNGSISDILPQENTTNAHRNESTTDTPPETSSEVGNVNRSAFGSTLNALTSVSNSSSSVISSSQPSFTTMGGNGSKIENQIDTNIKSVDDKLVSSVGKPLSLPSSKAGGEIFDNINATRDYQVNTTEPSHADTVTDGDADPVVDHKNIYANRLSGLTSAEALNGRGKEKTEGIADSSEKSVPASISEELAKTDQPQQSEKFEQLDPITDSILDTIPSKVVNADEKLIIPKQSEKVGDMIDRQSKLYKENAITGLQNFEKKKEQQEKDQHQGPKGNAVSVKDKPVQASQTSESHIKNELATPHSDRTQIEDVNQQKITSLQKQKIEEQKTLNHKRISNSEDAKEQRQKNEAIDNVMGMINKADEALINVKGLIKQSKLANQRAHDAIEMVKNQPPTDEIAQEHQANKDVTPPDLSQILNEAKILDQTAQDAIEHYNDLRNAANMALEEFNAQFG